MTKKLAEDSSPILPVSSRTNDVFLRVAAVLDSPEVPAWAAQVLAGIKTSNFAELVSVVIGRSVPCQPDPPCQLKSKLFRRYLEWDKSRYPAQPDPLAPVDLSAELAGVPAVPWTAVSADVVLWFSERPPVGLDKERARFGVWFHPTAEEACFWELYNGRPVTSTRLLALQGAESVPVAIAEQHAATKMGWSININKRVAYWKASFLILRSLRRVREGVPAPAQSPEENSLQQPDPAAGGAPSNTQVVQFFTRNAIRSARRHLRYRGQARHWFMAYRTDRAKFISQTEDFHPDGFQVIVAPQDHFYADPFVLEHGGRNFIFFEEYSYRQGKGVISVLEMDEHGPVGAARRVLERPYHLSYPFLFAHEGEIYLLPETFATRRVELYRAVSFPERWELAAVLQEGLAAADTTLWIENGVFYFFTSIAEKGASENNFLHLFCADSLTGPWHPHPENPLKDDVRSSRGAGKLFRRRGTLIRPAQDCSVRYGYACQLNEVKVLSPERYWEAPLSRIEPDWMPGLIGTHTINSNDWIEVIDGQIYKKLRAGNSLP